jgi:hypothetical protein
VPGRIQVDPASFLIGAGLFGWHADSFGQKEAGIN